MPHFPADLTIQVQSRSVVHHMGSGPVVQNHKNGDTTLVFVTLMLTKQIQRVHLSFVIFTHSFCPVQVILRNLQSSRLFFFKKTDRFLQS